MAMPSGKPAAEPLDWTRLKLYELIFRHDGCILNSEKEVNNHDSANCDE